ncbi:MAG TPA: hypothetical protein VFN26_19950 [Candidatus Acidoferrum sp.]|nr:hypothetical protein [Candidatus Acidoferrum sp.]
MSSSLLAWQERLEHHFLALRKQRSDALGDRPLFALEHDLTESEISDLSSIVRKSAPSDRYWLVWTVYATELGYQYEGVEYWPSFEENTPGWALGGDRGWLRDCFWKFAKTYGGARPSGPWATHFSIICWPITHAILSEDLQRQLAEILYQIRYLFRKELFDSPELLGNEIAARSWTTTRRFQMVAEEPLLLGQIAAALLIGEKDRAKSLITPDTLLRIAKNLNKERREREWLKDARSAAKAKLTGISLPSARLPVSSGPGLRQELRNLGIEPRVYLRPTLQGSWNVVLEIPDLGPLLSKFPELQETLTGACVVTGSSGRPLARGRLLHYGPQSVILKRWPDPSEVLLHFENQSPELEYILSAECMLRPSSNWLFKISSDGTAREIRGGIIRPGSRYILLSRDEIPPHADARSAALECEAISATYLDIDPIFSQDGLTYFQSLGLAPARQVDVRPAGLPPVLWDGEGYAEWLSTDQPSICVSSDHHVDAITLNLEGTAPARLDLIPQQPGERIFVEIPQLPTGNHVLHVLVGSAGQILLGQLEVAIRDPRPWKPGLTEQNALLVIADPPNPSLEQVWEGRATLQVQGPPARQGRCEVVLTHDVRGTSHTFRKQLPQFVLPLPPGAWEGYFDANVRADDVIQNIYDAAYSLEIRFAAEELGQSTVHCRREFAPLRWLVKWENHGYVVRLRDDTGLSQPASLTRYEFERPDEPIALQMPLGDQPFRVSESGGLFSARSGDLKRSVILPPLVRSLSQLRTDCVLHPHTKSAEDLNKFISLYELWSSARITGATLSATRRDDVLAAFMQALVHLTCGNEWVSGEIEFERRTNDLATLKSTISRSPIRTGFGAAIWLKRDELTDQTNTKRVCVFCQVAKSYLELPPLGHLPSSLSDPYLWIAEFALRLMTRPDALTRWAASQLNIGLQYLLTTPTLARGARFLGLAVAYSKAHDRSRLINLPNWEWQ